MLLIVRTDQVVADTAEPTTQSLQGMQTMATSDDAAPLQHRKTTQELTEEFKNLNVRVQPFSQSKDLLHLKPPLMRK